MHLSQKTLVVREDKMQPPKLNVQKETYNGIDSIKVIGPFDMIDNQIDTIVNEVIAENKKDVVFDFLETTYITSAGLAALTKVIKKIGNIEGTIYIANITEDMHGFISCSSLDRFFKYL